MDRLVQLESTHDTDSTASTPVASSTDKTNTQPVSSGNLTGKSAISGETNDLQNRLDSIWNNAELDNKAKIEEMYKFYLEEVLEELKNAHKQHLDLKL